MERIGHLLADGDYDLVLLEELWMRPDHETIKSKLGPGLHMTEYDDLNQCQGTLWPWGCSGLAIVSRSPVKMCESFLILSISDSPSWRRTSLSLSSRGRSVTCSVTASTSQGKVWAESASLRSPGSILTCLSPTQYQRVNIIL